MSAESKKRRVLVRREITSLKEIDQIEGEQRDRIAEVIHEQKEEKRLQQERLDAIESPAPPAPDEDESGWQPPRTLQDFQRLVDLRHPDWSYVRRGVEARLMFQRAPFLSRAFQDGLKVGRDLRERAQYGRGWWWESLQPLAPFERTYVIEKVKQVIMRDVPKERMPS